MTNDVKIRLATALIGDTPMLSNTPRPPGGIEPGA